MNWDAIGACAELVGAIGVIATLGYLAVQIRQNTNAVKLGTSHAVIEEFRGMFALAASNQGILDCLVAGATEPIELAGAEKARYYTYMSNFILAYQNAYLQMGKGVLENEQWEGMTRMMIDYTDVPGFKEYWHNRKHWTSSSFQQYMDTEIVPSTAKEGVSMVGNY
jgi:hypothetical protein